MITLKKEIEAELREKQALWRGGPTPKTAPELLQAAAKSTKRPLWSPPPILPVLKGVVEAVLGAVPGSSKAPRQ